MKSALSNLLSQLNSWLSPDSFSCVSCGGRSTQLSSAGLCSPCNRTFPWILEALCEVCGRYERCYDCERRERTYFAMNRSVVVYDAAMKNLLALYKYRGQERLQALFVEMLSGAYDHFQMSVDVITFTPLSSTRLAERGFNQAEQLARGLGAAKGIPVVPLLARIKHTEKQSFKTRKERLGTLEHVFSFQKDPDFTPREGLRVLIVDDVYTTGSTLNECAKVIREGMWAEIYGLTWAR
ncbi:hypothetical protein SY83_10955 [Paenibacillus swuensis]|uniref:Phosphoribosyltransferase domain-containing protein n=1 Tax=Paenibacillus swuensis TaxID=1178515 RepID=A0A172TPF3_9BACL|nr:hypothetical protein SY83_10955 [Paenibacillus swuensis]